MTNEYCVIIWERLTVSADYVLGPFQDEQQAHTYVRQFVEYEDYRVIELVHPKLQEE